MSSLGLVGEQLCFEFFFGKDRHFEVLVEQTNLF